MRLTENQMNLCHLLTLLRWNLCQIIREYQLYGNTEKEHRILWISLWITQPIIISKSVKRQWQQWNNS